MNFPRPPMGLARFRRILGAILLPLVGTLHPTPVFALRAGLEGNEQKVARALSGPAQAPSAGLEAQSAGERGEIYDVPKTPANGTTPLGEPLVVQPDACYLVIESRVAGRQWGVLKVTKDGMVFLPPSMFGEAFFEAGAGAQHSSVLRRSLPKQIVIRSWEGATVVGSGQPLTVFDGRTETMTISRRGEQLELVVSASERGNKPLLLALKTPPVATRHQPPEPFPFSQKWGDGDRPSPHETVGALGELDEMLFGRVPSPQLTPVISYDLVRMAPQLRALQGIGGIVVDVDNDPRGLMEFLGTVRPGFQVFYLAASRVGAGQDVSIPLQSDGSLDHTMFLKQLLHFRGASSRFVDPDRFWELLEILYHAEQDAQERRAQGAPERLALLEAAWEIVKARPSVLEIQSVTGVVQTLSWPEFLEVRQGRVGDRIEASLRNIEDILVRLTGSYLGHVRLERGDGRIRVIAGAGLEDYGPDEAKEQLNTFLWGREANRPLSVTLAGFLPKEAPVAIGPLAPEAVPPAVGPVLDALAQVSGQARVRWESSPDDADRLTLRLTFVPLMRVHPFNLNWGMLAAEFRALWRYVNPDGDYGWSLDQALEEEFHPDRTPAYRTASSASPHPPAQDALTPEMIRALFGVDKQGGFDDVANVLLFVGDVIVREIDDYVVEQVDGGKDARQQAPTRVTVGEALSFLAARRERTEIARFLQGVPEPRQREFLEQLLNVMGFRQIFSDEARPWVWSPRQLGQVHEALRAGAQQRIAATLGEAGEVVQVLGRSVAESFQEDDRARLEQLAAASGGRFFIEGPDRSATADAVASVSGVSTVQYWGPWPEYGDFMQRLRQKIKMGFRITWMSDDGPHNAESLITQLVVRRSEHDPERAARALPTLLSDLALLNQV